ncbi:MAG: hypothetical protein A2521_14535 [Deltaproteobacteria bacterium RIFOXYD12_FULL_57_12]|nr:MAG: hypothetical protein A2521_14535 [Deltaproteobacteria bacterium RIFOXYD12_FULL_57_12]
MCAGKKIWGIIVAIIVSCSLLTSAGLAVAASEKGNRENRRPVREDLPRVMGTVAGVVSEIIPFDDRLIVKVQEIKNNDRAKSNSFKWAAIPSTITVKVGDTVAFKAGVVMENYHMSGIDRTFDRIIFSEGP